MLLDRLVVSNNRKYKQKIEWTLFLKERLKWQLTSISICITSILIKVFEGKIEMAINQYKHCITSILIKVLANFNLMGQNQSTKLPN